MHVACVTKNCPYIRGLSRQYIIETNLSITNFLLKLKQKYNFNTPEDWNSITTSHIKSNGGSDILQNYSLYEIKCLACPEGKSIFEINKNTKKTRGYWENQENIQNFLLQLKQKYNLNTPEDWNSITTTQISINGGMRLLRKYSLYELKCLACPEGESIFRTRNKLKTRGYWENKENIQNFLFKLKQKYNLNTPEDWNSITTSLIKSNGGTTLLRNHSMYDLKYMACPEGKLMYNNPKQTSGYWDNEENVLQFLSTIKEKYNLNTPEDWNSITNLKIQSNGGSTLLRKYSIYELKCLACPEGKLKFKNPYQDSGYWEIKENVQQFLKEIQKKYNLNTPEDWNSINKKQIQSNYGGTTLLSKYSMYELKCMAFPEGKSKFNPKQVSRYWEIRENVLQFLKEIQQKYNLNTPEDWNSISHRHIRSNGGGTLLNKYTMYELKCLACPEVKTKFKNSNQVKSSGYWENQENIEVFFAKLKEKYNLNTLEDWNRISKHQILSQGGNWLFNSKYNNVKVKIELENPKKTKYISCSKLISGSLYKRSSQRWLFLQIQKLFPNEEIVEDYFHSDISRLSGFNVQFDVYMIEKKIAIEYHGKQHYEDLSIAFGSLEAYQCRDLEKEKLCLEHGIQLIVIPYWWDNKLNSLREYLYSKINLNK